MGSLHRLLIFFVVLGWAAAGSADIYVWIDGDGVRRFSNKPLPIGVTPVETIEELPFDALADSVRRENDHLEMQKLFEHWRIERQIAAEREDAQRRREAEELQRQKMSYQLEEARRWNRFYDSYFGPSYVPVFPKR